MNSLGGKKSSCFMLDHSSPEESRRFFIGPCWSQVSDSDLRVGHPPQKNLRQSKLGSVLDSQQSLWKIPHRCSVLVGSRNDKIDVSVIFYSCEDGWSKSKQIFQMTIYWVLNQSYGRNPEKTQGINPMDEFIQVSWNPQYYWGKKISISLSCMTSWYNPQHNEKTN